MIASSASTAGDGESPVELWSDAMHRCVSIVARAYSLRVRSVDYEDFYQEGCLASAQYIGRRGTATFARLRGFLRHRMRRLYMARRRTRTKDGWGRRDAVRFDHVAPGLSSPAPDHDAILDVRWALQSMPAKHRAVIWAAYKEHRSIGEIAASVGLKKSAIHAQLKRAYKALEDAVRDGYGEAEMRLRDADRKATRLVVGPDRSTGASKRRSDKMDWSQWGPIPNQREDD